jgi:hypothetical protein
MNRMEAADDVAAGSLHMRISSENMSQGASVQADPTHDGLFQDR